MKKKKRLSVFRFRKRRTNISEEVFSAILHHVFFLEKSLSTQGSSDDLDQ